MPAKKPVTISAEAYDAQRAELNRLRNQVKSSPLDLQTELDALRAENQRLHALKSQSDKLRITTSEKGCVSVHLGSGWPVSLYPTQWLQLIGMEKDLREIVTAHQR